MYQVNDVVIYGTHGVCMVVEVGSLPMLHVDKRKKYYTLKPVFQQESMIYAPVENQKIVMRPILSKEEVEELLQNIPAIETVWITNEKERESQYKDAIRTCDCRELIKVIKTLYLRKKTRQQDGKKPTAVDEKYFRIAEEQLYEELGYVLEKDPNQMRAYITDYLVQKS